VTDFLLVHGAWHGGWCWERVRAFLEADGHRVLAPTLTGLGDRAAERTPDIDLDTHIADLVRTVEGSGSTDVVAVAHSYAGVPVTALADRCRDRIGAVIYLDSGMPRDGQCANDVFPGSEEAYAASIATEGNGWLIPPPPGETFGITDPADLAWVRSRLTPHPLRTFTLPVHLASPPPVVPSAAIICMRDGTRGSEAERSLGDMPTIEVDAGHDVMVTHAPLVVAAMNRLLADLATG
jgi:pimeloyl-ACP methyl ester carboxylesterase